MGAFPPERVAAEGNRLPRGSRIRLGSEIRTLLREGVRVRSPHLDVFTGPSLDGAPRYGTVVPRYGRTAVDRNLLRRRLREIGRTGVLPDLGRRGCGFDVLVRSRPQAYEASFSQLRTELLGMTERLCSDGSYSG